MATFAEIFASVYRQFVTPGDPRSGDLNPRKVDIRAIGPALDVAIAAAAGADGDPAAIAALVQPIADDAEASRIAAETAEGIATAGLAAEQLARGGTVLAVGPSNGFYEGRPILWRRDDKNGYAVALVTSAGYYSMGAAGRLVLSGTDPLPDYRRGNSVGVSANADGSICYILWIQGQSNAEGVQPAGAAPISTVSQFPGYALMPSVGVRMKTRDNTGPTLVPDSPIFTDLVNLVEAADAPLECYETSASGCVNALIQQVLTETGRKIRVAAFVSAHGSYTYADLKRGSSIYGWGARALQDMANAIWARGWQPVLLPVVWRQGESDQTTPSAYYARGMVQFRANLQELWQGIIGKPAQVQLLLDAPQLPNSAVENDLVDAHRMAADLDPAILLGPTYCDEPRAANPQPIHLSSLGQYRIGVKDARAIFDEVFSAGSIQWSDPIAGWLEPGGTQVTLLFPYPVTIDISGTVVATAGLPNYFGLLVDDRTGVPITITSHSVSGRYLFLNLNRAVTAGSRLRVANGTMSNVGGVPGPTTGMRSCLRSTRGALASPPGPDAGYANLDFSRPWILELRNA